MGAGYRSLIRGYHYRTMAEEWGLQTPWALECQGWTCKIFPSLSQTSEVYIFSHISVVFVNVLNNLNIVVTLKRIVHQKNSVLHWMISPHYHNLPLSNTRYSVVSSTHGWWACGIFNFLKTLLQAHGLIHYSMMIFSYVRAVMCLLQKANIIWTIYL